MPLPPAPPTPGFENAVRVSWGWELPGTPQELWPLLSDTNRLNVLAGMAPVTYQEEALGDGRVRRVATGLFGGMPNVWEEQPYSWEAPHRFGVTRVFHGGVLKGYRCTWTLEQAGDRTRVTQLLEMLPRFFGTGWLVERKTRAGKAGWDQAYAWVAARFQEASAPGRDWPEPVAAIAARLEAADQPPELVARLVDLVLHGDALDVQYLRPFVLADQWGASRLAVLELCLRASAEGLLQRRWSHLCPGCRGPKGSVDSLEALAKQAFCSSCDQRFEGRFDASIELAFRPAVREVPEVMYCVGGPAAMPHVVFQAALGPGERRAVSLAVAPGGYRVRGDRHVPVLELAYGQAPVEHEPGQARAEAEGEAGRGPVAKGAVELVLGQEGGPFVLQGPKLELTLVNGTNAPLKAMIEQEAWAEDAVTAAMVTATPAFSELCGLEAPAEALGFSLGLMGFVAARLDAEDFLAGVAWEAAVARLGGAVAPGRLAAFFDPLDAVQAALALQAEGAVLACAVAAGPCEAVREDAVLGYRGPAVDTALALLTFADDGDLLLPADLAEEPGVRLVLGAHPEALPAPQPGDVGCLRLRASASSVPGSP